MKPKVWLVQNGHKPAGYENTRGKIDRVAKELIIEAVHNGAKIEGYELTPSTGPVEAPPTVEKVKANNEKVIAEPAYRYNLDDYVAVEVESGKKRDMREACRLCGHSVVGCWDERPEIVALDARGNVVVRVERK